ncbi:hypothetical protein [Terrisporobacter mayombei]|uniref:Uncharacterized protein n=1 Tax=Terrisporobacter mayombei TaxID=1541 RepID=A0ABY9PXB5_9FIRM|nr:hypothetical protein [Terrisporobacter mayombei]MCC3868193.1 hypothetical protein [Terrisporobacter mayombei]WMT80333.1 hypothetical protein TEMA_06480 [Terrisporobacter mayombei]
MKALSIDKYLYNLQFLKIKKEEIQLINENNFSVINELANFISSNTHYGNLNTFISLADIIVEFIEKFNNNEINPDELKKYSSNLKNILENLELELKEQFRVNFYFYGEDNLGIIENNLIKYDIKRICDENELKLFQLKDKNETDYNILVFNKDITHIDNRYFDETIDYSKVGDSLKNLTKILYTNNYDFSYLSNSLNESIQEGVEAIIVGNSYPLVGIEEQLLIKNTINLSMHSQDLYYAYELARKSISQNKNIKQCILGISHYVLNHDLSKGESSYSKNMIEKIYYPLLNDVHNYTESNIPTQQTLNDFDADILIKSFFDFDKIEDYFSKQIYINNKTYYNDLNPRIVNDSFMDYSKDKKESIGYYRSIQHNKLFKYDNTKPEYENILKEFINLSKTENIELIMVVLPTTKYYFNNIKIDYRNNLDNLIKNLKNELGVKVVDLRNLDFDDSDFVDSDHLNQKGAIKSTKYLNQIL